MIFVDLFGFVDDLDFDSFVGLDFGCFVGSNFGSFVDLDGFGSTLVDLHDFVDFVHRCEERSMYFDGWVARMVLESVADGLKKNCCGYDYYTDFVVVYFVGVNFVVMKRNRLGVSFGSAVCGAERLGVFAGAVVVVVEEVGDFASDLVDFGDLIGIVDLFGCFVAVVTKGGAKNAFVCLPSTRLSFGYHSFYRSPQHH